MNNSAPALPDNRKALAEGLSRFLADTYMLYLKTHYFHWNVEGPLFYTLHLLFEKQYLEMASAVDEIAERIRALGAYAPGRFKDYAALASIEEDEGILSDQQMLTVLLTDHAKVVHTAQSVFPLAEHCSDQGTVDLLTRCMQAHEKNIWMLKSLLKK